MKDKRNLHRILAGIGGVLITALVVFIAFVWSAALNIDHAFLVNIFLVLLGIFGLTLTGLFISNIDG